MTKLHKSILVFLSISFIVMLVYLGPPERSLAEAPGVSRHASTHHPVVLELFQSQGCSSCPSARAILVQSSIGGPITAGSKI